MTSPWLAHYDPEVPRSLAPYPERTLLDYVREGAAEGPDRPAILFKGAAVTNARLNRESDAFAAALAELGVKKGDRVALLLPNCPQFLIAELGIWKAGAIASPLNPIYSDRELREAIARAGAKVAVVLNRFYARVRGFQGDTPLKHVVTTGIKEYLPAATRVLYTLFREKQDGERLALGDARPGRSDARPGADGERPGGVGHLRLRDLLRRYRNAAPPDVTVTPDDPALLLMSGGTTGTPKAVTGLHRSLVASGHQLSTWLTTILRPWSDPVMLPLPLFHVYANAGIKSVTLMGHNPLILPPDPRDVNDLLGTIARERPAVFIGVPALFSAILTHPRVRAGKVDLSSIRGCFSGGSALMTETKRRFEEATGGVIVEGYSLTEAMMACCVNPVQGTNKAGSIGMPLPDVAVRIVDPDDPTVELPAGEVGELLLRAPQLMEGYWEDPAESENVFHLDADGRWLHTGDLCRLDDEGYVYVVDRKKDMIKVSGLQVWPREIEEVLAAHPAVAEVGVTAIPHERKGEVPKAWVVLVPGAVATEDALRAHCREQLAPFKVPARVEFCEALPRTMVGKVLRRELREREDADGEAEAMPRAG